MSRDDTAGRATADDATTPRGGDDATPGRGDDDPSNASTERDGAGSDATEPAELDEGRYLYCVVGTADETSIDAVGVEDEPVRLVTVARPGDESEGASGGVLGAVVHDCAELYDSADPTEIRGWLVRHQRVVDDAGEQFGTPLPFQFDTVIRGGDEAVRDWLRSERETLGGTLDALAGHWEYRIEVVRTEPIEESALVDGDDRLAELRREIDVADEGRSYLLEKQYEDRLDARRADRRAARADDVIDRVAPHAREVHELDPSPSNSIADETSAGDATADGAPICRLTVLAHEDDEEGLGEALDGVAADPGVTVRFTGPWPPYSFAPSFGDEDETAGTDRSPG